MEKELRNTSLWIFFITVFLVSYTFVETAIV